MPEGNPEAYGRKRLITPRHTTLVRAFMQGRGRPTTPSRDPQVGSPRAYSNTPAGKSALANITRRRG